jgi:histone demethylase JARID1
MTTALNPRFLIDHGVPVYTLHQSAGEFVVTFPRSYHAGYNEGLNFAEAVNFAPPDWLRMGRQCLENYAKVHRNCVFSHEELVMKMVSVSNKMSIGMCLATLEELTWIVAKETDFRKRLTAAGLRESQFCKFEELSDDDRQALARGMARMACLKGLRLLPNHPVLFRPGLPP